MLACKAAFVPVNRRSTCLSITAAYTRRPAPIIAACSAAFISRDNQMECIRTFARARYQGIEIAIEACAAAFYSARVRRRCVRAAARSKRNPAAIIRSCTETFVGFDKTVECIEKAVQ